MKAKFNLHPQTIPVILLLIYMIKVVVITPSIADALIIFCLVLLKGILVYIKSKEVPQQEVHPDLLTLNIRIEKLRLERELANSLAELNKAHKSIGGEPLEIENKRKHKF